MDVNSLMFKTFHFISIIELEAAKECSLTY